MEGCNTIYDVSGWITLVAGKIHRAVMQTIVTPWRKGEVEH